MNCPICSAIRRQSFIANGLYYLPRYSLDTFVTIKTPRIPEREGYEWDDLIFYNRQIWQKFARHGVKFIKSLSMDSNEYESYLHPHFHLILSEKEAARYVEIASDLIVNWDCKTSDIKPIYDEVGVLGYIYDKNFKFTQNLVSKPKGIRLLTASKGMLCGFPGRNVNKC